MDGTWGLIISGVSVVCTAVSVWLKMQIKLELHEMMNLILKEVRAEYATREGVDARFANVEVRLARLERGA